MTGYGKPYRIITGDCREVLPTLEAESVSLICTDPPYGAGKGFAGDGHAEEALALLAEVLPEFLRVLKPNGSCYIFAGPQVAARVEVLAGEYLRVLQRITWRKPPFSTRAEMFPKDQLRTFFPASEAIIFAGHPEAQGALRELRTDAGLTAKQLCEAVGAYGEVNHGGAVCNWECGANAPTEDQYIGLRTTIPDLPPREDFVRPFAVTADVPYTDVWDFPTVPGRPGKHPCEKPVAMLEHIISVSSRPGALVLDPFCGSGSAGVACFNLGRKFLGVEISEHWAKVAEARCRAEVAKYAERLPLEVTG